MAERFRVSGQEWFYVLVIAVAVFGLIWVVL